MMGDGVSVDGLNRISGYDEPNRIADVIFVHGLDGDAFSTWQSEGKPENFWPQWLGEDFPDVGVWSFGYAVSSSAWKGSAMPLADRATNALDQLELDGIGHRPVIFVCHSLGGLLVKQMLRHANDFGNPNYQRIVDKTCGIVFLSTPHSGSSIANWIKHIGTIVRKTVSVDELQAHDPQLRNLNTWFRNYPKAPQIKTLVYCETRKLKGLLVVDETSADPGIVGVAPVPTDDDHISICKPKNRDAQVYKRVKRLVEEIAADTIPKGEIDSRSVGYASADDVRDRTTLVATNNTEGGGKRFKIALSFPGEHRPFIEQIAENLAAEVGRKSVLYDRYYEAEFARPDLDIHLQALYHDESELIAVFLCADYEQKDWCGLEWRAIRELIKQREVSAVMPLRFDTTEIPGLFSTDGYVWIGERTPQEIAELILQRFRGNSRRAAQSNGNSQSSVQNGEIESGSGKQNTLDPTWRENHLQFQNKIRGKIIDELAKDTVKPLRDGFIEILWTDTGKEGTPSVPELVDELFSFDKAIGCANAERLLEKLIRATESCLERLESAGEKIAENHTIWKTAEQILGWLATLAVRKEELVNRDNDSPFDEIDVNSLIGVEVYTARKNDTSARFQPTENNHDKDTIQGTGRIGSGHFPEPGWQAEDAINDIYRIVWKAAGKKERTAPLTEEELLELNKSLALHRTRRKNPFNYHFAVTKMGRNHPLLNPGICRRVKDKLSNLTIVHVGTETGGGALLIISEGVLVALIDEFLNLIDRYQ